MSKSSNKTVLIISIGILIILIIVSFFLLKDKTLDLNGREVTELYQILGTEDIYHCGGLNVYDENAVTLKDLEQKNTLCMAYYNSENLKSETLKVTEKNKNKEDICRLGENVTFLANKKTCKYYKISKDELNNNYEKLYGEKINEYKDFSISSNETCFLEGDYYYCGEGETYTYSLSPETTIYRLLNKAQKQVNGDVTIYDYYLKISDNKCYISNNNLEDSECSEELKKQKEVKINEEFVKKYGKLYKHSYKKNNNSTYWIKSEPKD